MIIEKIEKAKLILSGSALIETSPITTQKPLDLEHLRIIEKRLQFPFPRALKEIYINEVSKVDFKWFADKSVFGQRIKMGELSLLSPDEIENMSTMIKKISECYVNNQLPRDQKVQSIIEDWANWVPIVSFMNGDAFCIDKRSNKIVFFEHDVMDGGPNSHGIIIANNFEKLLDDWAEIAFVNPFDWTDICNFDGIDLQSNELRKLVEFLGNDMN